MRSGLTGKAKVAMLLIALGREKSTKIFKHLKEEEIEELTLEIASISSVTPDEKEEILNEFYNLCLAQDYIAEGGINYAQGLLEEAGLRTFKTFDFTLIFVKIKEGSFFLCEEAPFVGLFRVLLCNVVISLSWHQVPLTL